MAVGVNDLTTLAAVKEWLNIPTATTTSDAILQRLVTNISAQMQTWMSRNIKQASYTETYNGSGTPMQALRNTPILSVQSLAINGVVVPQASTPTSYGYLFDENLLYLVGAIFPQSTYFGQGGSFPQNAQNVVVSYTAGYAEVPADLAQACIEWVGYAYRSRDRIGMSSGAIAGQSVGYITGTMPDSVKSAIQQYKRVVPV